MANLIDAAVDYCRRGWSIIPLRWTGDIDNRKRPAVDAWEQYQQRPAPPEQVRAWWSEMPQANIGIIMGKVSGLVALDLDGPHAVDLLRSSKVQVPKTATVGTGKGYHAYYRHPGYEISNRARLLKDSHGSAVDVRGDGGYVVAPPSVHGSGRVYQWLIPPTELTDLPPDLATLITQKSMPDTSPGDGQWLDAAMEGVPEGQRDDTCARLAGYWLRLLSPDDCLRILRPWALRCTPPYPDRELRKTVSSVSRLESSRKAAEMQQEVSGIPVVEAEPWLQEIESHEQRKGLMVPVPGIAALGGLVPGRLVTLAGRPGMGKSTMACQLSVEAGIKAKVPTLVISTEMTRREWGVWMAAYLCGTTVEQLSRPLRDTARAAWLSSPIGITDAGTISIKDIRRLAESRIGLKLLIVDHVGRVVGGRKESRTLEVGDVARGLKSIAKDLDCTVLSLCQMNRRIEGSEQKQPRLDDLRESGELEQESDSVTFLWTDEHDKTMALLPMTLTLEKNRHGPTTEQRIMFDKARRKLVG